MKELTPFEGFQEHTLSLSVCFPFHKASLLSYSLSPPFCVAHCSPATTRKSNGLACGGSIPKTDFSLPSYKPPILLANIFLKLLSDMREMNICEKTRRTYFSFVSGLPEWLPKGAEAMGCTWFLPLLWGPNQECMEADTENAFTLFHLPASIITLTAVTALGQAKGERERKVYLKGLPRPREEEISLAHYRAVLDVLELCLFPDYRAHHAVLTLFFSPSPAPCTGGARLGRLSIGRSSYFAGGIARCVQSEFNANITVDLLQPGQLLQRIAKQ